MNLSTNREPMTEIQNIRKFMFNRSFLDDEDVPKKPVFTAEQVEAARKEGFAEGYRAGQASTQEEQQAQYNALVEKLLQHVTVLVNELAERRDTQQNGVTDIALAIIQKTMPATIKANGLQEIQALVSQIINELSHEPRFVLRVNGNLVDRVNDLVQSIAAKQAYAGQIIVLADPELHSSDCKIEWADGGIERNLKLFWEELDKVVERLTGTNPSATTLMEEPTSLDAETQTPSTEEAPEE